MRRRYKSIASLAFAVLMMLSVLPTLASAATMPSPSWSTSSGTDYIQVRLYSPNIKDTSIRFDYYQVELSGSGYSKMYFSTYGEYVTFNGLRNGTEYLLKVKAYYFDSSSGTDVQSQSEDREYVFTKGGAYDDYGTYWNTGSRSVLSQPSPYTMGHAVFVVNGNYERLNAVNLSGYNLSYNTDYTYEYIDSGRLRVTLYQTALNWLTNGYHNVVFTYADGLTASTTFQVNRNSSAVVPSTPPQTVVPTGTNYTVTASSLRVRQWGSSTALQISSLVRGTTVAVQEVSGGWGRITLYGNVTGWVSMQYLLPVGASYAGNTTSSSASSSVIVAEPVTSVTPTTGYGIYYTTVSLRMRSGPSATVSNVLGVLPAGTSVYVSNIDGGWAHCTINGQTVYVDMAYLRK